MLPGITPAPGGIDQAGTRVTPQRCVPAALSGCVISVKGKPEFHLNPNTWLKSLHLNLCNQEKNFSLLTTKGLNWACPASRVSCGGCSTSRSLLETCAHGEQGRGSAGSCGERQGRAFCRVLHILQLGCKLRNSSSFN